MLVIQFVHVSLVIMNAHVKGIESVIVTQVIALVIQVIAFVTQIGYVIVIQVIVIVIHSVHVIQYALQRILVRGAHVKETVRLRQQLVAVVYNIKILEVQ